MGLPPVRVRQKERLESAEVLRAGDREVAGADLVTHLEEQRTLPAPTVDGAAAAHKRLKRLGDEVDRRHRWQRSTSRHAEFAVRAQRLERW